MPAPLRSGVVGQGLTSLAPSPRARTFGLGRGGVRGLPPRTQRGAQSSPSLLAELGLPVPEMAVLCRTRAQMEPIAAELEEARLPIIGLGGMLYVPGSLTSAPADLTSDPERRGPVVRLLARFHQCRGLPRAWRRWPASSTRDRKRAGGARSHGDQAEADSHCSAGPGHPSAVA